MRAASLVFPFMPTFGFLQLEKRWWHRLCVVIFFATLLCAAIFTAGVTYTTFAPSLSAMPEIAQGDIFDQVASQATEWDAEGNPIESTTKPTHGPWEKYAVKQTTIPPPPSGTIVMQQTQPMLDLQGTVQQVPLEQVNASLAAGSKRVVKMIAPDGVKRWIPEDEVQTAIHHGGKFADSVSLDMSTYKQLNKTIQMPDGSTLRFASTVSDDSIKTQWNRAKLRQTLKAISWAALITIGVLLLLSYLLQIVYRALLYVIFGNTAQEA